MWTDAVFVNYRRLKTERDIKRRVLVLPAQPSTNACVKPELMKLFTTANSIAIALLLSTRAFSQCTPPPAPSVTNDTVIAPGGVATLTATGDSVRWYDVVSGGTPIATGNTFTTPNLTSTTTYYATNVAYGGGELYHGGKPYHTGTVFAANNATDAQMQFDVLAPSTLVSVTVYTDFPGKRVIQLFDSNNNLVAFDTVNVQVAQYDSTVLTLNFPLMPGTGYYLTTDSAMNQQIPSNNNYTGPRFARNSSNVVYPYAVDTFVSITGNNTNPAQYYYFYDWVVQAPTYECESEPTAAEVYYDNSIGVSNVAWSGIALFPNPATDAFYVRPGVDLADATLRVTDVSGRVVLEKILTGTDTQAIDASLWANGVYNVKLQSRKNERVVKLMIQR